MFPPQDGNERSEKFSKYTFKRLGEAATRGPTNHVICRWGALGESCSFLASLGGGFGDFTGSLNLVDSFDDTDSNGLSHVTDGETSKRWVLREGLYAHWLKQNFIHDVKHDFKTF